MKEYVKILLYAYPFLRTVGKDYEEHIRNKAVLSYEGKRSAESLAEYLAGEILQMRRLEWLKERIDGVLASLSDVERTLLAIRYFGKVGKIKSFLGVRREGYQSRVWTERTYFRRQRRLGEKVAARLVGAGVTEEVYLADFAGVELFQKLSRGVAAGKDKKISACERRGLEKRE